ncbi:hypothetical protein KEM54_001846, partial [Ascosphaera aggregata]
GYYFEGIDSKPYRLWAIASCPEFLIAKSAKGQAPYRCVFWRSGTKASADTEKLTCEAVREEKNSSVKSTIKPVKMMAITDLGDKYAIRTEMVGEIKEEADDIVNQLEDQLSTLCRTIWKDPNIGSKDKHMACPPLLRSAGRLVNFSADCNSIPGINHACGHNLITTASVTAFLTLSRTHEELGIEGRVQLLGTPDEEGEGETPKPIKADAYKVLIGFGEQDILSKAATPAMDTTTLMVLPALGWRTVKVQCRVLRQAGGNPCVGSNALNAVVSAYNMLALLRQRIQSTDRIHSALVESGHVANIIPAYAKAGYYVRSAKLKGLRVLEEIVKNLVKAAALETGCEDKWRVGNVSYELTAIHAIIVIPAKNKAGRHSTGFAAAAGTKIAAKRTLIIGKLWHELESLP